MNKIDRTLVMVTMLSLAAAVLPDASSSVVNEREANSKKVSVQAQERHRNEAMNQYGKVNGAEKTGEIALAAKASEKIKTGAPADESSGSEIQVKTQEQHQNAVMSQQGKEKAAPDKNKAAALSGEGETKAEASVSSESKQNRIQTRTSARKGDSGRGELRHTRNENRSERNPGRSGGRTK